MTVGVELWFKTQHSDGLILLYTSAGGQEEFVAVQLRERRPWFLFDPQGIVWCYTVYILCVYV